MKIEPGLFYRVRTAKEFREIKTELERHGLRLVDGVVGVLSSKQLEQRFKEVEHTLDSRMQIVLIGQHSQHVNSFVAITDLSAIRHHEKELNPEITLVDYLQTPHIGPPKQSSLPNI